MPPNMTLEPAFLPGGGGGSSPFRACLIDGKYLSFEGVMSELKSHLVTAWAIPELGGFFEWRLEAEEGEGGDKRKKKKQKQTCRGIPDDR